MTSLFTWLSSWFVNTLAWWQWVVLLAVPPAIVALYFLRLKRRPLEVPSTYLWHKSIEDLHVNSLWQRLRRNLLLLLQLLLLLLLILALLRPSWEGKKLVGDRFIFLIDNSASMQATDVEPSRLEEAKRQVRDLIDEMESDDVAMIISFSDSAQTVQSYTNDRGRLQRSLEAIAPTYRRTSLLEALKLAAGLANPGRSAEEDSEYQAAEAMPADLYIFSDGQFGPVTGFSLGNLAPVFVPIGETRAANVGILALSVGRNEMKPDQVQALARVRNFGTEPATVELDLLLSDDRNSDPEPFALFDHGRFELAAGEARDLTFDLGDVLSGELKLALTVDDHLDCDDVAYAVITAPRRVKLLLVTSGNEPLEKVLATDAAMRMADVTVETPDFLETDAYRRQAAGGRYDLVIYDGCRWDDVPQANRTMPRANTFFIGGCPPEGGWSNAGSGTHQILAVKTDHPLLQWIDLSDVIFAEGAVLQPPSAASVLGDSEAGPVLAMAPREGFEDLVLGFAIIQTVIGPDNESKRYENTNWPTLPSFTIFAHNLLSYFQARDTTVPEGIRPGSPVTLKAPAPLAKLRVLLPGDEEREESELQADRSGQCNFSETMSLGVYDVQYDVDGSLSEAATRRFAVNLFDRSESDICAKPEPSIKIGYVEVAGQPDWETGRQEIWKILVLTGLVVLLLEWYIYNRRVYV